MSYLKLFLGLWAFHNLRFGRRPSCSFWEQVSSTPSSLLFRAMLKKYIKIHLIVEYPQLLSCWGWFYKLKTPKLLCYVMHKLLHDSPNITETARHMLNKLLVHNLKINFPLRIIWQDICSISCYLMIQKINFPLWILCDYTLSKFQYRFLEKKSISCQIIYSWVFGKKNTITPTPTNFLMSRKTIKTPPPPHLYGGKKCMNEKKLIVLLHLYRFLLHMHKMVLS